METQSYIASPIELPSSVANSAGSLCDPGLELSTTQQVRSFTFTIKCC
jgi:hypothetical protein